MCLCEKDTSDGTLHCSVVSFVPIVDSCATPDDYFASFYAYYDCFVHIAAAAYGEFVLLAVGLESHGWGTNRAVQPRYSVISSLHIPV